MHFRDQQLGLSLTAHNSFIKELKSTNIKMSAIPDSWSQIWGLLFTNGVKVFKGV